uniref:Uncharacterized protein n=1 Tax=Solanum tuberosum TaxID=4113 RepID=M1D9F1_SOLTU
MDSGSENLTFSLKNGGKLSRKPLVASISPQQPRPDGSNPALAACTKTVNKFKNSKPPFHNTPSSHDTQNIPVHAKISFGSSTGPNSIS